MWYLPERISFHVFSSSPIKAWLLQALNWNRQKCRNLDALHGIDMPRRDDILLGRGKTIQGHPGNVNMRSLVDSHLDTSKRAFTGEKNILAPEVVATLKRCGCRFLKKNEDGR
jgi:hypothetical protein